MILRALLGAWLLGVSVSLDANADVHLASEVSEAIDALFAEWDRTDSPGCAVAVIHKGEIVHARGYGMANLELGIANSPTSAFRIASTSKQFTAACVALLALDGTLALDDDIRELVPELPAYERPITIRHLLHHTSGLRDYLTLMSLAGKRADDWYTTSEAVAMVARQRATNFAPGDEHLYSNTGYLLLGLIVERASGESLRAFATERIFAPLGMRHTRFQDDHTELVRGRATGYSPGKGGGFRIDVTNLDMVGDGGVFTTIEDLALWDENFYTGKVGGKALIELLETPGVLNSGEQLEYALGLAVDEYRGQRRVSHGGSFVGYRAQMMRFPGQRFTVICLANLSSINPTRLCRKVADLCLADVLGEAAARTPSRASAPTGGDSSAPEEPFALEAAALAAFAGAYYAEELDARYEIELKDGALVLKVGAHLEAPLEPRPGDELETARGTELQFQRDASGAPSGFLLSVRRVRGIVFERL